MMRGLSVVMLGLREDYEDPSEYDANIIRS